jgi:TPR repeat protein
MRPKHLALLIALALSGLVGAPAHSADRERPVVIARAAAPRVTLAAERGDARAQARLGFMYATGRDVPQNYTLAAYWYRRGAEQGNATAQHLLGLAYDKGFGVPGDLVLAHMWLNLAAARTRGEAHEDNVRLRDAVAGKLSLGQLADAQQLAAVWVPKPERLLPE